MAYYTIFTSICQSKPASDSVKWFGKEVYKKEDP